MEQPKPDKISIHTFFWCDMGSFPFRYLGIPMHHRKLMNKDWKHVEQRFRKGLNCWRSKMLSVGGRLVLINSVLSSLPLFMFSFFEYLEGVLKKTGLLQVTVFLAE
jgi:hypothetical protein